MDLQERLRAHMRSELANTPVSDLGGVMERGETIRRRRRAVMTAAPVVVVVLGVVGVMASGIMSDEDAPDADQVAAAEAELSLSLGTRDWAREPGSLGWAEDIAADDGVFHALSPAPGVRWEDFPMGTSPRRCTSPATAATGARPRSASGARPGWLPRMACSTWSEPRPAPPPTRRRWRSAS